MSWSPGATCAVERIERAFGVEHQGVAAVEDGERRERVEAGIEGAEAWRWTIEAGVRVERSRRARQAARRSRAWASGLAGIVAEDGGGEIGDVCLALAELRW